jgi:hypothetical protein
MVFGYEINHQNVFVVKLIPSMNEHHYPIVKLRKTLISYSSHSWGTFYEDIE